MTKKRDKKPVLKQKVDKDLKFWVISAADEHCKPYLFMTKAFDESSVRRKIKKLENKDRFPEKRTFKHLDMTAIIDAEFKGKKTPQDSKTTGKDNQKNKNTPHLLPHDQNRDNNINLKKQIKALEKENQQQTHLIIANNSEIKKHKEFKEDTAKRETETKKESKEAKAALNEQIAIGKKQIKEEKESNQDLSEQNKNLKAKFVAKEADLNLIMEYIKVVLNTGNFSGGQRDQIILKERFKNPKSIFEITDCFVRLSDSTKKIKRDKINQTTWFKIRGEQSGKFGDDGRVRLYWNQNNGKLTLNYKVDDNQANRFETSLGK